jgi:hypothetical protein
MKMNNSFEKDANNSIVTTIIKLTIPITILAFLCVNPKSIKT